MKLAEITNPFNSALKTNLQDTSGIGADVSYNMDNKKGESFSDVLEQSFLDVNNDQVKAYNAMDDIATGKVENLSKAVQKIEEAELSLRLGLEVKNKALSAYKQVMSMQI
jgi:flagellar hook-basal body complex protein FliE